MDWNDMNDVQKLMVQVDFFDQSFDGVVFEEEIGSFIAKRDEDVDGEYTEMLKKIDKETAGHWKAKLKNALRELDELTDWGGYE